MQSSLMHPPYGAGRISWDLAGAVDGVKVIFDIGYQLANSSDWPRWGNDS